MRHEYLVHLVVVAAALGFASPRACAEDYAKLAPYSGIRWTGDGLPEVRIDGQWYALRSIDGLSVDDLIVFAKKQYGGRWEKRFNEDIVQVLSEMGHPPGRTASLVVRHLETGKERSLDKVPMTTENRKSIMESKRASEPPPARNRDLSPEDLLHALDEFKAALDGRWSYRHANRADFDGRIRALREQVAAGISPNDFGIELQKIIALGIDGHADVSGYQLPPGGCLPFLVEPTGERFVAFNEGRTDFLAKGFPYLTRIDGKDITAWCAAAAVLVPKGSPQYVRRQCLRQLRELDYLRTLLALPKRDTVEVELAASKGSARKTLTLRMAPRSPAYGTWPRGVSCLMEGNIGYLRLADLDATASVPEIRTCMPRFRETVGLVVDVRDNGGGERDALLLLYSYLAVLGDPPRVFTAAAYRRHEAHQPDHLVQRFMYPADAESWTEQERVSVAAFAKTFRPAWELPEGQFSEWHYMALSRLDDASIHPYSKPVVVLMNEKCFSATDILLAGLKGMKNVTLLGTPSGGGSALKQKVSLGATPFALTIGSMASFQADGTLFDGNGVHPDVIVEAAPEYYIGGPDNVLAEAVKRLRAK